MPLINCLNLIFCGLRWWIKDEFMDLIVNNIWLTWKLSCMLRPYRTSNLMMRFSKYEFNNKLLDSVTLLKLTLGVS